MHTNVEYCEVLICLMLIEFALDTTHQAPTKGVNTNKNTGCLVEDPSCYCITNYFFISKNQSECLVSSSGAVSRKVIWRCLKVSK